MNAYSIKYWMIKYLKPKRRLGKAVRLFVEQDDRIVKKLGFSKGPILIGRGENCQVVLPGSAVSRQHAIISRTQEGKWVVEDLDLTYRTCLNGKVIRKSEIRSGDRLRIADFTIEIYLGNEADNSSTSDLQNGNAALAGVQPVRVRKPMRERKIVVKKPKSKANVFLATVCGMIIGLIATLILKFMGGRFF